MSDIPQVRYLLGRVLKYAGLNAEWRAVVEKAVGLLGRERAVRKSSIKSARITHSLKQRIHDTAVRHPSWSYQEIADDLLPDRVNTGRISEVLAGKRGARYAVKRST